ncbi:hypothetical protein BC835DRAFT_1060182 [Cytidiella melzeri]|nr:hypothetical protein BC835DRAFT_1060182 [Cytidiella melzeri]
MKCPAISQESEPGPFCGLKVALQWFYGEYSSIQVIFHDVVLGPRTRRLRRLGKAAFSDLYSNNQRCGRSSPITIRISACQITSRSQPEGAHCRFLINTLKGDYRRRPLGGFVLRPVSRATRLPGRKKFERATTLLNTNQLEEGTHDCTAGLPYTLRSASSYRTQC